MKYSVIAAFAAVSVFSTAAVAQTATPPSPATPPAAAGSSSSSSPSAATTTPPAGMQMSQSECTSLWQKANSSNAAGLTESQSSQYVSDFKAANPDGDTTIDQAEWMAACNKGLVKSSSSTGTSSGSSGSSSSGSSSSGSTPTPPAKAN